VTSGERLWLWSQPLVASIALIAGLSAWILQLSGDFSLLPSLQSVVTGSFVLPGLALSLAVNHLVVLRRAVPILTSGEKLLLLAQYILTIVVVATSLDPAALLLGYLLWPLLIAAAVSACVSMVRTTRTERRGESGGTPLGTSTDEARVVDSRSAS
jgi:hypothetical protein